MLQRRVVLDTLQFITYNLLDLILDAIVVVADSLLHDVIAIGIGEVCDDGNWLIAFHLCIHLGRIHHNLSMENLLLNTLVEVVGYRADKHSLRQSRNLAGRDKAIHLRVDGSGNVLSVYGNRLAFLEHLAETLTKLLGGLTDNLPTEDVADGVHYHLCLLVAIVTDKLGKVLKAEAYRHLVASGGCNEVVESLEIDGGQLVNDDRRLQLTLLVNQFHDTAVIQTECCTVDVLTVGIVTDTQDFRLVGVVDVKRKLAVRPICPCNCSCAPPSHASMKGER